MSKDTGLGANFYVDGVDLSGDTNSLEKISKSLTPINMTGINKFAFERLAGQLSGAIDWTAFMNPTAGQAHPTLSTLPRTDRIASYWHKATVLGTPVASLTLKQMSYDPNRANDGKLDIKVATLSNAYWLDWGVSLTTGKRTDTAATNGTGLDLQAQGMPAAFGLQAYLHVFSFTGTSATITLQGSSDNAVGDPYANIVGGSFTVVTTAPQSQRIETARNQAIERYCRVVTTGVFSNLVFAVAVVPNRTDMTL